MSLPVFVDAAALLALANTRDQYHGQAKIVEAALTRSRVALVTSDWVLTEFLNGMALASGRTIGADYVHRLRASARTMILAADRPDWNLGFGLFTSSADKDWSLADCISIVICRRMGIRRVFTADHHFRQAGFQILMNGK